MKHIEIFIHGACNGNPGPGGWGAVLRMGPHAKTLSGHEAGTTQNRMELTALIRALRNLIEPCHIRIGTSGHFLPDGMAKWQEGWTARGWDGASHRPIRNADLWHSLIAASLRHDVEWLVLDSGSHPEITRAARLAAEACSNAPD